MSQLSTKFVTDANDMDYGVVEFHGDLDQSTIDSLEPKMADLLKSFNRRYLVFDLADLGYANSEGIGLIVSTHMKLTKRHRQLLLSSPQKNVLDVFNVIGLAKLLPIFPSVADAVSYMKKTKT